MKRIVRRSSRTITRRRVTVSSRIRYKRTIKITAKSTTRLRLR